MFLLLLGAKLTADAESMTDTEPSPGRPSLDFYRELLARTLSKAVTTVPFYKEAMAGHGDPLTLQDFPLIDKYVVAGNFDRFLNLDRFPDFVTSSGGTLANAGAFSLRCQEEYEAVHHYFSGRDPQVPFDTDPAHGFALDIFTFTNGYHWRKPPRWPVLPISLEQETHAEFLARLICDGLEVKGTRARVRHVQGQCGPMRALTGYFDAIGFRPGEHAEMTLLVYGSHTTDSWQNRYKAIWGCQPRAQYGLAEFAPGCALQCDHCLGFHFFTAWPEFLALDHDAAVGGGDARLVLTGLFPFVQLQPRIRYVTGDIVTLDGICGSTGRPSFRFRGRATSSVVERGATPKVLFSEIEILEVLDRMNGVAHQMQASERRIWDTACCAKPIYAMGYPRYRIEVNEDDARVWAAIQIEVDFDPERAVTARAAFLSRFEELLDAENPAIATAREAGWLNLTISLHAGGSLPLSVKASA